MSNGTVAKKWGLIEVCMLLMTLIMLGLLPYAHRWGVELAQIAVTVTQMGNAIQRHIDLPRHSGAPSIEQFDKLDAKVDRVHDEQIEQRAILSEIRTDIKSVVKP